MGAIWTLCVLSILIASYAMDAHLQTRVNLYLRERMQLEHLIDAGLVVTEVLLTGYQNVEDASQSGDGESSVDYEEKLEDDRFYREKYDLKNSGEVDTGAIPVDATNIYSGTVRVQIKAIESKWNINKLYPEGNPNHDKIWEGILIVSGIPEDYWDGIIDSWYDWRDSDDTKTGDEGAESEYYSDKNREDPIKYPYAKPRNGEIATLDELLSLKGFCEDSSGNPINGNAILNGGVLNPEERKESDYITITNGLSKFLSIYGDGKINVNMADEIVLSSVPGFIMNEEVDTELVKAVLEEREIGREYAKSSFTNQTNYASSDEETGLFKSFDDLKNRMNGQIQQESNDYLIYEPAGYFNVTITVSSMGVIHSITAVAKLDTNNNKVRYVRWNEDVSN